MGGHDRCCVAGCDNDKRRPNETIQRGHVEELIFHRFPKDEKNRAIWISQVRKGLANFELGQETRISAPIISRMANLHVRILTQLCFSALETLQLPRRKRERV